MTQTEATNTGIYTTYVTKASHAGEIVRYQSPDIPLEVILNGSRSVAHVVCESLGVRIPADQHDGLAWWIQREPQSAYTASPYSQPACAPSPQPPSSPQTPELSGGTTLEVIFGQPSNKEFLVDQASQTVATARAVMALVETLKAAVERGSFTEDDVRTAYHLGRMREELFVRTHGERDAASAKKSRRRAAQVQKDRSKEKATTWKEIYDEVLPDVKDKTAAWPRVAEEAERRGDLPEDDPEKIPDYCGTNPVTGNAYSPSTIRQAVTKFFPAR